MRYSAKFREKMIEKLTGPGSRSATTLSKEVGVAQATLSRWLVQAKLGPMSKSQHSGGSRSRSGCRRRRWSAENKVRIFVEAASLADDELGAFLRREGLHEADLERLGEEVEQAATEGLEAKSRRGPSAAEKELRKVRKELARKERALAEAAALLVLRGKAEAFFWGGEEGDTDGSSEK